MDGDRRLEDIRAALRSAGTDIWDWEVDTDGLSDADLGFEQLGYGPGDLALTQAAWAELMHPDDRGPYEAAYRRYRDGEEPMWVHVYRIRARDGRWRWFEERGRFVEWHADGRPRRMVGTQTDVTAQREAALQAQQAMQRLERIARHVPGMLFQFRREPDGSASFPYVSERCRALLGVSPEAMQADASTMLRRVERTQRESMLASVVASARALAPWRQQFGVWRAGEMRWLRGSATPQREAGGTVTWHGYVDDVTDLLGLEAAQRDKAAAEAASQAKTSFLSSLSHELRTPLNAMLGFTQLMAMDRSDPATPGQRQRLQAVLDSGAHLLQMVGDLLDLTRIESGAVVLRPEPVPLAPLVEEVHAMLRPQAQAAQVQLLPPTGLDAAAAVCADRLRLRQVLLNLVGNGIKYNRAGGQVAVHVAPAAAGALQLSVQDDGSGIAPEDLPRLFEPFYRGAQAHGRVDGAGVGLAVTRSLVEAMGGHIEAANAPGAGACFTFTLPRA